MVEDKLVYLDGETLSCEDVEAVAYGAKVQLQSQAKKNVEAGHLALMQLVDSGEVIYGLNTGFGALQNVVLERKDQELLSRNILRSHSIARGNPLPKEYVRAGIVVRINSLIKGQSGVSMELIDLLCELLNQDITPVIPDIGSLACSGDLCLLAHLGLVVSKPILEDDHDDNDVIYKDQKLPSSIAFGLAGLEKITFGPKEGLSITNGSSITAGIACLGYMIGMRNYKYSLASLALSMEATLGCSDAFHPDVQEARPHKGQIEVAKSIRNLLEGSQLINSSKNKQDAYSSRCMPQIMGVLYERLVEFDEMLKIEINSVTDNPILSKNNEKCLSAGNFNGSVIGQLADSLHVALTNVAHASERRISRIVDDKFSNGLPCMLVENSGLNSGAMIAQYTTAALVLRLQQASMPASVLSISTCCGQEDLNSNAYNGVMRLMQSLKDVFEVILTETICATRGLTFRDISVTKRVKNQPNADGLIIKKLVQVIKPHGKLGRFGKYIYEHLENLLTKTTTDHSMQKEFDAFSSYMKTNEYERKIDELLSADNNAIVLSTPRGMMDFGPADMVIRNRVMKQIQSILEKHGLAQIETPHIENRETLFGKYGNESEKLVFDIKENGAKPCTLRYDLTVPMARYVAQNNLTHLRRFQHGDVFRRDNPAMDKGRFRSFKQCDADIVGHFDRMVSDSEIIKIMADVLSSFNFDYVIKYSDKGLLDLLLALAGVPIEKAMTVASSIDKLDKESWEDVASELSRKEIADDVILNLKTHLFVKGEPKEILALLIEKYPREQFAAINVILDNVKILFEYLEIFGCLNKLVFDLSLARGLSYYTGTIVEAVLTSGNYGSISGGGRYDRLIGNMFSTDEKTAKQIPAVGVAFGIDRIIAVLKQEEKDEKVELTNTKCYVTFIQNKKDEVMNKLLFTEVLKITQELWNNDISTQFVQERKKMMVDQIGSCLEQGIKFMILIGSKEIENNQVVIKKLTTKEQITIAREDLIENIVDLLI